VPKGKIYPPAAKAITRQAAQIMKIKLFNKAVILTLRRTWRTIEAFYKGLSDGGKTEHSAAPLLPGAFRLTDWQIQATIL